MVARGTVATSATTAEMATHAGACQDALSADDDDEGDDAPMTACMPDDSAHLDQG